MLHLKVINENYLKDQQTRHRIYSFADLELDTRSCEVKRADQLISLPILSFNLLLVLLENAPSTQSQEKLIELVWKDNIVGDETLKQRIKLVRKSLDDDAQSPRYIGVVRGRGYHLIPSVKVEFSQPLPKPKPKAELRSELEYAFHDRVPNLSTAEGLRIWKRMSMGLSTLILILISVLYILNSRLDQQEQGLKTLVSTQPSELSQAYHYFLKGRDYYLRYRVEDNQIAIQLYQHALSLDPNLALAHAGLADAYSQGVYQFGANDDWKTQALHSAEDAVRLAPENEVTHKALGLAQYLNGQLKEAIASNLQAVKIKPKYLQANTNLAFIYREMGQLQKALEWNFRTISIDPFYAPGYLHLAQSYQAQGKNELAKGNFVKALELKPDYQLAIDAYSRFLKVSRSL